MPHRRFLYEGQLAEVSLERRALRTPRSVFLFTDVLICTSLATNGHPPQALACPPFVMVALWHW